MVSDTKPIPEPMRTYFQLYPQEQTLVKFFCIKLQLFLSSKYMSWSVVCEMSSILCRRFCVKGCLRRQDTTLNMCVKVVNDRSHKYVFLIYLGNMVYMSFQLTKALIKNHKIQTKLCTSWVPIFLWHCLLSYRLQMGPMLAPWTLLSGILIR